MNTPTPYIAQTQTSTAAVLSLIFGLLSWIILPFIGAVAAVICGHMARSEIKRNAALDGDGLAIAGMILGYLHLAVMIVSVVAIILFFGSLAALLAFFGLAAAAH